MSPDMRRGAACPSDAPSTPNPPELNPPQDSAPGVVVHRDRDGHFAATWTADDDLVLVDALDGRLRRDRPACERLRRRMTYRSPDLDGVRRLPLRAVAEVLNERPGRPDPIAGPAEDLAGMPVTELHDVARPLEHAVTLAWSARGQRIPALHHGELARLVTRALTLGGREQWRTVQRIEDRLATDVWLHRVPEDSAHAVVSDLLAALPVVPASTTVTRRLADATSRVFHQALGDSRDQVLTVLDPTWVQRADLFMRRRPTAAATVMNLRPAWLWAHGHQAATGRIA